MVYFYLHSSLHRIVAALLSHQYACPVTKMLTFRELMHVARPTHTYRAQRLPPHILAKSVYMNH